MTVSFKGAHFPPEIICMGVRWYLAYPLSTRHVEALMAERAVKADHAIINRWVVKYSPHLEEAFHRRKRPVWVSWRLDETYRGMFRDTCKNRSQCYYAAVAKSGCGRNGSG
jgi:putative transposase